MTAASDRDRQPTARPVSTGQVARRYLLRGLLLLIAGLLIAAAIQTGFNILRYLIQPDWLAGRRFRLIVALAGLLAALAIAVLLRRLSPQRPIWPGEQLMMLALAVAIDPYFLAYLGWRGAPEIAEWLAALRALALWRALVPRPRSRRETGLDLLVLVLVLVASVLPPRFWLVPKLPGDLETAAMAPIHLLVFAKAALFVLIGGTLVQIIGTGSREKGARLP